MENERSPQITTTILVNYAFGILLPDVAAQVETALYKDEVLRWQYEGILQLMQDHPDEDPEELLEQMADEAGRKIIPEIRIGENRRKVFARKWLLAAAFILIVAVSFLIAYRNSHSIQALATALVKEHMVSPFENTVRGGLQTTDSARWKTAFANNDFKSVVSVLKNKENKNLEEQFFLALSYLRLSPSQPGKAEPLLIDLTEQESNFRNDAWLYLGLTQTLLDKKEQALTSLHHVEQTVQVKELEERLRK